MRRHIIFLLISLLPAVAGANTLSKQANAPAEQAKAKDKEVRCLALNIYHEARGEPHDGQLAVAYVTMNRVASPRYPASVCEVVWQYRQFSWTHDNVSDIPRNGSAWAKALRIANFVYSNYFRFREITKGATDMTKGALFYFAPKKVSPYWTRSMITTASIGSHVFLTDESQTGLDG